MSNYLGFQPTTSSTYYFVSYNNEDADRISQLVCGIKDAGVPLWYDYGLEYGEEWARQINEKIANAQAVILFFTKGILRKDKSYVKKEYKIAKTLEKKIFVLFIDEVSKKDVSIENVDWWVDIVECQGINAFKANSIKEIVQETKRALGIVKEDNSKLHSAMYYACPYCGKMIEKEKVLFMENTKTLSSDLKYGTFLRWHGMETPPGYKYPRVFYRVRPEKNVVREDENGFPTCIEDSPDNSIIPKELERDIAKTEVGICDDTIGSKENLVHRIPVRACPFCHCKLPFCFGTVKSHHVMMFGNRKAGKTAHIVSLFQQLQYQLSENRLGSVDVEGESAEYLQMITDNFEKNDRTMPTVVYRGMFPIVCRYRNKKEEAMIVFDDIAGEGTADLGSMEENNGIRRCETIMLMLDPMLLTGKKIIQEEFPEDTPYSYDDDPNRFSTFDEFLSQVSMVCEEYSPMIRNVICVITKLDMLIQEEGETFLAECPHISNDIGDDHFDGVNSLILERVGQEIGCYFQKHAGIDLRDKLKSAFGPDVRVWLLGVSTATRTDNGDGEVQFKRLNNAEFRKHRIIEPFLAILLGLGLAEEKNEVGSYAKELSEAKHETGNNKEEARKHGFWTRIWHKG